jgi:ClpP class serine protease
MKKKKPEPVDELLDALVWMRRKAKKHEPVDDLIDALMRMRRKTKKKTVQRHKPAASPKAAGKKKIPKGRRGHDVRR